MFKITFTANLKLCSLVSWKWPSCHLVFRTRNSTIQSADPENSSLEPNMEWIGWCVARYRHMNFPRWRPRHHLGFYRTANSGIQSADPKNPGLEPNMEWIRCTVCKIFAFKLYCDLETGVPDHSRSSKVALFDRAQATLYASSIVTMPLSITVFET